MTGWLRRNWLTLLLTIVGVGAAAGAFVIGIQAGAAQGIRQLLLIAAGSALTGLGIVLAAVESFRRERAKRSAEQVAQAAEESLMLTLNGAMAPITSYLGELAVTRDKSTRRLLVGQVLQAAVDAAVRLTTPNARSTYYEYDPAHNVLNRVVWGGRSSMPRAQFVTGTADGDLVIGLVRSGEMVFIRDIEAETSVLPRTDGYRTLIAVTVTAGSQRLGLLTVDSPVPGDLTEIDKELVRVLGNLLAGGIAQV
ncbi:hypothetical protein GCM10009765_40660 [Fodinicola feengrottensis]|uniref:GAF domain-containing protein n=1 Tax=Fodinicola feengrottensis TaxID=435914 RepID=A0ABP4TF55_9ACTN